MQKLKTPTSPTKSPPHFLASFCPLRNYRETSVLYNGVCLAIWTLYTHILVRIAQQYLRSCLSVHPTYLIKIKFLRLQERLSVTSHAAPILLAAQDHTAEVFDSTGTDFGLKIPSFPSSSLTMKESVLRIIHRRITIDAIWLCHLAHPKHLLTKITVFR